MVLTLEYVGLVPLVLQGCWLASGNCELGTMLCNVIFQMIVLLGGDGCPLRVCRSSGGDGRYVE